MLVMRERIFQQSGLKAGSFILIESPVLVIAETKRVCSTRKTMERLLLFQGFETFVNKVSVCAQ
jgi:hypothetical protein